jgi:DNA invertase Pin-like site-specific DNA recombinase
MIERRPFAYIRRSVTRKGDSGDVSREFQTDKVRALAGDDAGNLTILDGDWGVSAGTDSTHKRLAFLGLIERIEAGGVSHLYAYSPDRLARSVEWAARLVNACRRAGVPITTTAGTVAPDDPSARSMFNMLAVMTENELERMSDKNRSSYDVRRERNIAAGLAPNANMGRKSFGEDPAHPDESVDTVLNAFELAGRSFLGAARYLNAAGVPTRLGGPWSVKTVSRIIRRENDDVPSRARQGSPAAARHVFTGLIQCACGQTLTTQYRLRGKRGAWHRTDSSTYYCSKGLRDPRHPRPYTVSEPKLVRWAQETLTKRLGSFVSVKQGVTTEAAEMRLDALAAKRLRFIEQYADGILTKTERDQLLAQVADDQAQVRASLARRSVGKAVVWTAVDWNADPATINAALSTIWSRVVLNGGMYPRAILWVPCSEWGVEGPA